MPKHPLAEVFGFPPDDMSLKAKRYRKNKLCPFNNRVPNCTKDKAKNPLGVCSIHHGDEAVITCPVRFRQEWLILDDAADFFFPENTTWTSLTEVRLADKHGKSAGNIDVILVAYDDKSRIIDFGALEVQAVYISGNVSLPFHHYMENPIRNFGMDWTRESLYPRPDYLSSSRKRLAPQLIFKGGILKAWEKKSAVALGSNFFDRLPPLQGVAKEEADIAWLVYDLVQDNPTEQYALTRNKIIYTKFEEALHQITRPEPGEMGHFMKHLQKKLDDKINNSIAPEVTTVESPF